MFSNGPLFMQFMQEAWHVEVESEVCAVEPDVSDDLASAWAMVLIDMYEKLLAPPSKRLNKSTLDFLRGFVAPGYRNDALNKASNQCAKNRIPESEACTLCLRGAELCGLLADEPEQSKTTFSSGYNSVADEVRVRKPKITEDRTASPDGSF